MSTEQTVKERRPFHETIIEAIRSASSDELECLARLIRTTRIPKGHDEIIAAWNERWQKLGYNLGEEGLTLISLLEQKQEVEANEQERRSFDQRLDQLDG